MLWLSHRKRPLPAPPAFEDSLDYWKRRAKILDPVVKKQQEYIKNLDLELQEIKKLIDEIPQINWKSKFDHCKAENDELIRENEKEATENTIKINQLDQTIAKLTAHEAATTRKVEGMADVIDSYKSRIAELEAQIDELVAQNDQQVVKIDELEMALGEEKGQATKLWLQVAFKEKEIQHRDREIAEFAKKEDWAEKSLKAVRDVLQEKTKEFKDAENISQTEVRQLREDMSRSHEEKRRLEAEKRFFEQAVKEMSRKLKEQEEIVSEYKERIEELETMRQNVLRMEADFGELAHENVNLRPHPAESAIDEVPTSIEPRDQLSLDRELSGAGGGEDNLEEEDSGFDDHSESHSLFGDNIEPISSASPVSESGTRAVPDDERSTGTPSSVNGPISLDFPPLSLPDERASTPATCGESHGNDKADDCFSPTGGRVFVDSLFPSSTSGEDPTDSPSPSTGGENFMDSPFPSPTGGPRSLFGEYTHETFQCNAPLTNEDQFLKPTNSKDHPKDSDATAPSGTTNTPEPILPEASPILGFLGGNRTGNAAAFSAPLHPIQKHKPKSEDEAPVSLFTPSGVQDQKAAVEDEAPVGAATKGSSMFDIAPDFSFQNPAGEQNQREKAIPLGNFGGFGSNKPFNFTYEAPVRDGRSVERAGSKGGIEVAQEVEVVEQATLREAERAEQVISPEAVTIHKAAPHNPFRCWLNVYIDLWTLFMGWLILYNPLPSVTSPNLNYVIFRNATPFRYPQVDRTALYPAVDIGAKSPPPSAAIGEKAQNYRTKVPLEVGLPSFWTNLFWLLIHIAFYAFFYVCVSNYSSVLRERTSWRAANELTRQMFLRNYGLLHRHLGEQYWLDAFCYNLSTWLNVDRSIPG
jgi:hypothetical protein